MNILKLGTKVTIGEEITATIVEAVIHGETPPVRYLCAWWCGNERKECWLSPFEIEANISTEKLRIGFKT